MGARRHGQGGGALAPSPPSGNVVQCFCPSLDPAGELSSQTPNLPTPGKNPAGAHAAG